MTYINLPNLNNLNLDFNIIYKNNKSQANIVSDANDIIICYSLYNYLHLLKQTIDEYYEYWDILKKITNPYEYIHTIVPNHKCSLCKHKPLSRSFFKMIEIIDTFSFLNEPTNILSFHLAEGPGGFIEAFNYKRNNKQDTYYGMTLISDNVNIPSWKKATQLLSNNRNIKIEYGASKTGDLFLKENLIYCYKKYFRSMDYITADGGFDFSLDFNNQEDMSFKLILSQVFFALIMQKQGGNFILKIFDVFKIKTIEVIYLLCNLYENVFIFKPNTSRCANSEKYIICRNFKNNNKKIISNIIENFDLLINKVETIYSLFNIQLNQLFITKLQEINSIYGQQQLENIKNTINLIREFKILNIQYNLLNNNYNSFLKYLNILNKNIQDVGAINEDEDDSTNNISNTNNTNNISNTNNINNTNNTTNNYSNTNISAIEIFSDDYIIIENNSQSEINDLSSTNISNEIVSKYFNKLNMLVNINIQKSINWCKKHQFMINKEFILKY
jgi:23S rRNA U2552 (ribose-2'-O)-methylase RlmE/FtsJ